MKTEIIDRVKMVTALSPVVLSAGTTTSATIDRASILDGVFNVSVGAASGAPTTQSVLVQIQHGDKADGSDLVDATPWLVSVPAYNATLTADNTNKVINAYMHGLKQYVAVKVTVAFTGGTSPKIPVSVSVALGNGQNTPL